MQERINRADTADHPDVRPTEHAREDLRQRLERLADGHPSSDRYRAADVSRPDRGGDTSRTDTNREDATGADTSREETTATRREDATGADTSREETTATRREDATGADTSREETTATRRGDSPDTAERAGSGSDAAAVRDHTDKPAEDDIHLTPDRQRHILDGDGAGKPGGGHRHGTDKPGKTEFPERWSDDAIVQIVEEVGREPDSLQRQRDGSWLATRDHDAVRVHAVVLPDGRIWTAWPEPGGVGVRQNPKGAAA